MLWDEAVEPSPGRGRLTDLYVQLQAVLDALPQMAAMVHDGVPVQANLRWREFFGNDAALGSSRDWLERVHADERVLAIAGWREFLLHGHAPAFECRLQDEAGIEHWFEVRLGSPAAEVPLQAVTMTDISARRRLRHSLEQSLDLQDRMLDASMDCIQVINSDGTVRHMNRSGCVAFGLPQDERTFGMQWADLLPAAFRNKGRRALAQAAGGRAARFAGQTGSEGALTQFWDNVLTPMFDGQGQVNGILCVSRDVSRQQHAERRLRIACEIDELTGLPNRRSFNRRLRLSLQRQRECNGTLGLMIIDLDHFKHVNDTLGHSAGDHLLRVLARRVAAHVSDTTLVTRLGGDEFAVVLEHIAGEAELLQVAEGISLLAESSVTFAGQVINTGMSIGCAMYPRDACDPAELLKAADTALNDLKANGRGGVRLYSRRLMAIAEEAANQRLMARQLVRDGGVVPHYQPKVNLQDGRVVGYEALLRWPCVEDKGIGEDCQLDEAFRDYELASRLAEAMHLQVLADIRAWQAQGLQVLPIAINAAPVEFLRDDFAEILLEKLQRFAVDPVLIELEITEQVLTDRGSAFVARALGLLKEAGMRIALDDFGTGHSSLAHLRDYPIDVLKIDRSFVARMVAEPSIRAIVEAVGKLGPSLRLDLVAEGVENASQRQILIEAGYRIGQGFLYDRAVDAAQVAQRLQGAPKLSTA